MCRSGAFTPGPYADNARMPKNRIRDLRKERGLTVASLAEKAGISHPYLVRIEGGKRGLSVPIAERLAMALETDVQSVLGLGNAAQQPATASERGFAEDVEPYQPGPDDLLVVAPKRRQNVDPWLVKTSVLDLLGIRPGDVVLIDISGEAVEGVQPLQAVVAQFYGPDMTATTIMRQFVPPSLLITNSSQKNEVPLNIDKDDVHIKGVVVGTHRSLRA